MKSSAGDLAPDHEKRTFVAFIQRECYSVMDSVMSSAQTSVAVQPGRRCSQFAPRLAITDGVADVSEIRRRILERAGLEDGMGTDLQLTGLWRSRLASVSLSIQQMLRSDSFRLCAFSLGLGASSPSSPPLNRFTKKKP